MKVSLNIARATSTTCHNDRSMYMQESPSQFEKDEHPDNQHYDYAFCGSSLEGERQFYEEHFREKLDRQNAYALKSGHPERVMTMDEYHAKHMPWEAIHQLGNLKEDAGDPEFVALAADMMKEKAWEHGLEVISYDIHYDEATPHGHFRFIGIDGEGNVNMERCLRENGVKTPLELACEKAGIRYELIASRDDLKDSRGRIIPSYDQELARELNRVSPELFYQKRGQDTLTFKLKSNTCMNTFTNTIWRDALEKLAMERGHEIDTIRQRRQHLTIQQYRAEKEQQDLIQKQEQILRETEIKNMELQSNTEKLAEVKKIKDEQAAALEAQAEEVVRDIKRSYNDFKKTILDAIQSIKNDRAVDPDGRVIDRSWIEENRRDLERASFRDSKKTNISRMLDDLQREIERPDTIDIENLQKVQASYDQHMAEVQKAIELDQKTQEAVRRSQSLAR